MSRPYFETEVVKIKKPYCKIHNQPICSNLLCKEFWGCEVVEAERRKKLKIIGNCPCCGKKLEKAQQAFRHDYGTANTAMGYQAMRKTAKGNWINGENLDKIKFPCFCRFDHRKGIFGGKQGVHGIGIINRTTEGGEIQYQLSWGDRQMENSGRLDILANLSVLCTTPSLKKLIELYDIHIRKGKIIIYEEE